MYIIISIIVLLIGAIMYYNLEIMFSQTMQAEDIYKIKIMFVLLVFNIAFTFPMSIWGGIITAYEKFIFQKMLNLARVILNPLCMMLLLLMGYRAIALVVVTTFFNVVTLLANAIYCKHKLHVRFVFGRFQLGFFKEVFAYSFWIFLSAIVDRLYWSSGQFILGIYISAVEIAIFAVAIQIQAFYGSFSFAISNVLLPKIVGIVVNNKGTKEISDFFTRMGRVLFYPMALLLFGFILFGRQFVILWAGKNYDPAFYMTLCFIVPELFTAIQQTGYSVLQAQNKVKYRSVLMLVVSVIAVVLCIPLTRMFGGLGCAIGIGGGLFVGNVVLLNIYYHRVAGLDMVLFWKNIIKMIFFPVSITIAYWIVLQLFPPSSILFYCLHVIVFTSLYIIGSILLNFNEYEKELLLIPIVSKFRK